MQKDIDKVISDETIDIVNIIYDQCCLIEGGTIDNPNDFVGRINSLLS